MCNVGHFAKEKCCGCGACKQICPTSAIVMEADVEAFLYPKIDEKNVLDVENV